MQKEEIKNILIQELKRLLADTRSNGVTQMYTLCEIVERQAEQPLLDPAKWALDKIVYEIVNDWQRSGIVFFGKPGEQSNNWVVITDFGKQCIVSGNFIPYDPEGYIRELQSKVPSIDDVTLTYICESIATYNSEHLLSSTITLGAASENMILSLIEVFTNAIVDPTKKAEFEKKVNKKNSIAYKYEEFEKELELYKRQPPLNTMQDYSSIIGQIFTFVRINRNNAGHPTGKKVDKTVAYSNLQIFASYAKQIFDLIEYFSTHQI